MTFSAEQIAGILNGQVVGDSTVTVNTYAKIEEGKPGAISFFANSKYENYLYNSESSIIIINKDFVLKQPTKANLILVDDAYQSFTKLLQMQAAAQATKKTGIQQPSVVSESAKIGDNVFLGVFSLLENNVTIGNNVCIESHCSIGENVIIGNNCHLQQGVKIYPNTVIGNNVTIKANTVIGSEGFGFAPNPNGTYSKIPQLGNVQIGDNVSIGANCTIDCATMGSTIIGNGVKIDNLVQVAHNVTIGENTILVAQSGVAGSAKLGKQVVVGGQAAIVGHITIADGTKIGGQSGVTKSVRKENTAINGTPAHDYSENLKSLAALKQLPEFIKKYKESK
jgi:UDP-3-O-[3-hydroxymyristoyl] glucosamine N-acyltransferase